MRNFISEDDIEQAILSELKKEPYKYDIIICDADPGKRDDLNDGTGVHTKATRVAFAMSNQDKYITGMTITSPNYQTIKIVHNKQDSTYGLRLILDSSDEENYEYGYGSTASASGTQATFTNLKNLTL